MKADAKRLYWPWIGVVLAAGVVGTLIYLGIIPIPGRGAAAVATGRERSEPAPVAVTTAAVTPRALRRSVSLVGSFYGLDEVAITPKIEGRVRKILHDVGDIVRPGEALLEIEEVDYRLAVSEAQRAVEAELAKIGLSELPAKDFEVAAVPTVLRADLLVKNTQTRLSRIQRLRGTGAATVEDADQAETDYRVAQATHKQMMMDAQATLATARHKQALLETARQRLSETRVLVPDPTREKGSLGIVPEYVVAQRMVSEGEMVRAFPSSAAFRLVRDRPLKLQAAVPERHVGEIKVDQDVEVRVEAYPRETFAGKVARVNPTVDRANRTFPIEIVVANEERRLKAGSFARASVFTRQDAAALTVPEEALVTFAGVTKVFAIQDGKAQDVEVRLGTRLEIKDEERTTTWVEVDGALTVGTPVVTSGHAQLARGMAVRVRE